MRDKCVNIKIIHIYVSLFALSVLECNIKTVRLSAALGNDKRGGLIEKNVQDSISLQNLSPRKGFEQQRQVYGAHNKPGRDLNPYPSSPNNIVHHRYSTAIACSNTMLFCTTRYTYKHQVYLVINSR